MQDSPFKGVRGIPRLENALRYSMEGLAAAFRNEEAFRLELFLAVALIPATFLFAVSGVAKALMIASVLLVLIVELLNSAIEVVVDRISTDSHPLAKRAKDIGSAAVFLSLINAGAIWLLVLLGGTP